MNILKEKMKLLLDLFYKLNQKIIRLIYSLRYPFILESMKKIHVLTINQTIDSLINSNKSISRFGDGEISWMLGDNKYGSFEESSNLLKKRLLQVLTSNNNNLEIGLPDAIRGLKSFTQGSTDFWKGTLSRYWPRLSRLLNYNKDYYNTSISRCYMDYKDKNTKRPYNTFKHLKKIWNNKNLLIIEGKFSRLGATNDFFANAHCIKRLECPPKNAFEHYTNILNASKKFLKYHKSYIALLSLGPTATILSYDLCRLGFRSIDIGHVDLEYEWFLHKAKNKINIPTKYVNSLRLKNGEKVIDTHNEKYKNQIIGFVK